MCRNLKMESHSYSLIKRKYIDTLAVTCHTQYFSVFCTSQTDLHYFWTLLKVAMTLGMKNTFLRFTKAVLKRPALTKAFR